MINFLFGFLVVIAVCAIVIIAGKWLMDVAGVTLPPPLLAIIGIIVFLILLFALWHFVGSNVDIMPRR